MTFCGVSLNVTLSPGMLLCVDCTSLCTVYISNLIKRWLILLANKLHVFSIVSTWIMKTHFVRPLYDQSLIGRFLRGLSSPLIGGSNKSISLLKYHIDLILWALINHQLNNALCKHLRYQFDFFYSIVDVTTV